MFQVRISQKIAVYPTGKRQLLLQADRVGGAFAGGVRHTTQGLQVLLFRHDLLESGAYFARLQIDA